MSPDASDEFCAKAIRVKPEDPCHIGPLAGHRDLVL